MIKNQEEKLGKTRIYTKTWPAAGENILLLLSGFLQTHEEKKEEKFWTLGESLSMGINRGDSSKCHLIEKECIMYETLQNNSASTNFKKGAVPTRSKNLIFANQEGNLW